MILSMLDIPVVKIDEIIEIGGSNRSPLRAVVCNINPNNKILGYDIEAVYLQDETKCVKVEVVWDGGKWEFMDSNGMGFSLSESESYRFKSILKI